MTEIPRSHPRYRSLVTREALVEGVEAGLVAPEGLIAHGRGEAYDYLLGETTVPPADRAAEAAAAHLLRAHHPVVSVNGNTAVLAAEEVALLQEAAGARVEVNLFHRTGARVRALVDHLEDAGARDVLGTDPDARIPGLDHDRAMCAADGIHAADVVLVPLEDGDRAQALRAMGKTTLVVDLNPLSRSARAGSVTLVDELTRALPNVVEHVDRLRDAGDDAVRDVVDGYDNARVLQDVLDRIRHRLGSLGTDAPQG